MFSITGTSLIGVTKGTDGFWTEVTAPTSQMTLDITASRYAIGCKITNVADGVVFTDKLMSFDGRGFPMACMLWAFGEECVEAIGRTGLVREAPDGQ